MNVQDIVDELALLGLDPGQARVYVHLCLKGPCTASDIAAMTRTSRTDTYRLLRALVARGFASATLERPVRFAPSHPHELFSTLAGDNELERKTIERGRRTLLPALSTLRAEPTAPLAKAAFRIIEGRSEIFKAMTKCCLAARTEILSVVTSVHGARAGEQYGLWETWQAAAAAGVHVRALIAMDEETRARAARLAGPLLEFAEPSPIATPGTIRFLIADGEQMVIFAVNEPEAGSSTEEEVAIATDAHDLVFAETVLFEEFWSRSLPLAPADADVLPP